MNSINRTALIISTEREPNSLSQEIQSKVLDNASIIRKYLIGLLNSKQKAVTLTLPHEIGHEHLLDIRVEVKRMCYNAFPIIPTFIFKYFIINKECTISKRENYQRSHNSYHFYPISYTSGIGYEENLESYKNRRVLKGVQKSTKMNTAFSSLKPESRYNLNSKLEFGEDDTIQFKHVQSGSIQTMVNHVQKYVVPFATNVGGRIFIGVDDSKVIVGKRRLSKQEVKRLETEMREMLCKLNPPLVLDKDVEIEYHNLGYDKELIIFKVYPQKEWIADVKKEDSCWKLENESLKVIGFDKWKVDFESEF